MIRVVSCQTQSMFEIKRCEFDLIEKHMQSNQNMNDKHTVHIDPLLLL